MSHEQPHQARNYILAGTLVLTPLLLTWVVFEFLFNALSNLGQPGVSAFYTAVYRFSPGLAEWLFTPWIEYVIAVVLTLLVLYFLGLGDNALTLQKAAREPSKNVSS